jgi:hypothetical protein
MVGGCKFFTKEFEKNLAQYRIDRKKLKYKLEAYQKNFLDFNSGSPISIKVSDQDEETKVGLSGIV